jgi:hypothetical protein
MTTKAPPAEPAMYVVASGFSVSLSDFDTFAPRLGSRWLSTEPHIAQMLATGGCERGFLVPLALADEATLGAARARAAEVDVEPAPLSEAPPVRAMVRCIERVSYQSGWVPNIVGTAEVGPHLAADGYHASGTIGIPGAPIPTLRSAEVGALIPADDPIVTRFPASFEPVA